MDKRQEHVFRLRYLPSLIFYGSLSFVIIIAAQLGVVRVWPTVIAFAVVALVIYLFTYLHAVRVSKEGISALDVWDFRHFVLWEDIESVIPIQLGNLRFLRLNYGQGKSVWLPLFLSRQKQFEKWINANVPKKHPVNQYFHK